MSSKYRRGKARKRLEDRRKKILDKERSEEVARYVERLNSSQTLENIEVAAFLIGMKKGKIVAFDGFGFPLRMASISD